MAKVLGGIPKEIYQVADGEEARFLFNVWRQLGLRFQIQCSTPSCPGKTCVIETPPIVCPFQHFAVVEDCPICRRRLSADLTFVFD